MSKPLRRAPSDRPPAPGPTGANAPYHPAIDAYATRLIARIQRNHQDVDAVIALQTHYEAHRDFPSLANLLEGWGHTLRDDRKAADAYAQAADAVVAGVGDEPRAQSLYLQALERYPEHATALDRLEALLRIQRDDKGIEAALAYVAAELDRRNADPKLRAGMHHRLGRHYEQRMLQPGRAIAEYRAALELDAVFMPAIDAALEIYSASGKTSAVADMYELKIAASSDLVDRHTVLMSLAKHRRERLGDLDGAVLAVRRALKAAPADTSTLELLANLLCERAQQSQGESADTDRLRAAELFFQVARGVRRSHARPRLLSCLALQPDHLRAKRMLAEFDAYGAQPDAEPELGHISQAEVEAFPTGRYAPPDDLQSDAHTRRTLEILTGPTGAASAEDEDFEAWLDDEDVEMIDEGIHPSSMAPVTDRPPPPDANEVGPYDSGRFPV
jgi:tetratricopeptide (TPR) repeat protein